jgi:cell wall-associated NlpC family hydrolase
MTGADVVQAARQYLDTPWRHQGRSRSGMDCVGLLIAVSRDLGVPVEDDTHYSHFPDSSLLLGHLKKYTEELPLAEAQPGDLVLMCVRGRLQHTGILTERGLLHAAACYRKVCEHGLTDEWRRTIRQVYRWKAVS